MFAKFSRKIGNKITKQEYIEEDEIMWLEPNINNFIYQVPNELIPISTQIFCF